ncbi:type II toxin-antitoxin system RelE/ParE family toxin [Fructilactobacillus frigidiflavus]|uniref:type II toxin-antitoxin system RelE/ParE family toxin n=1 Tax=Fructilactobacillus frigidiflavus TaxID=3242688 RepID=UPI0037584B95
MIKSFGNKETKKVFEGKFSKKIPPELQRKLLIKLMYMNRANNLEDLRMPPSNHLEKMIGDKNENYSIRINNQYRVIFSYINNDFYDVEFIDYH